MGRNRKSKTKTTRLQDLPDDDDVSPEIESEGLQVLTNILDVKSNDPQEYKRFRYILYATAIFILLSLPVTDRLIEISTPIANSWLILLGIKTVVFFFLFYILVYAGTDSDE